MSNYHDHWHKGIRCTDKRCDYRGDDEEFPKLRGYPGSLRWSDGTPVMNQQEYTTENNKNNERKETAGSSTEVKKGLRRT